MINTAGQPVVTGTTISSTAFNALTADLATGLSTAICKDGQTTTTGSVPFAQGLTSAATSTFSSTLNASGGDLYVKSQLIQCFTLQITNTAGTLQHKITSDLQSAALGSFSGKISGASATLANTPTGADASTAFVSGGKISSANTNTFILNTNAQIVADQITLAVIGRNTTGTNLTVAPQFLSRDVNGTTRIRQELFFNAVSGAVFPLTTANITAGQLIEVRFFGMLA